MDMERREDEPDPNGSGRNPASKHRFDMKTPMLWIPNLGDLCTADIQNRAVWRGFLGCHLGKLFNVSITGSKQSGEDSAAFGSELITVSVGEFAQKSVSPQ